MDLSEMFDKYHDDEFLEFERIEKPLHRRLDMCAFLILDSLIPGDGDIVGNASHDEIFLDVDIEELAKVITEEQVRDLIRCGVVFNNLYDCLSMFV